MEKRITPDYVKAIRKDLRSDKPDLDPSKLTDAVQKILDENGIFQPPVDVQGLAERLHFDIFALSFKKDVGIYGLMGDLKEGVKSLDNSNRFIVVEDQCDTRAKIRTVAHELGHFFIDCTEDNDYDDIYALHSDDSSKERKANQFKNELLMPRKMLKEFLDKRNGQSWGKVLQDIKEAFLVPRHTARDHIALLLSQVICDEMLCSGGKGL